MAGPLVEKVREALGSDEDDTIIESPLLDEHADELRERMGGAGGCCGAAEAAKAARDEKQEYR